MPNFKAIPFDDGVLVIADKPVSVSGWENWILYRSDTIDGSYSAVNGATGQAIADMTYYDTAGTSAKYYKVGYWKTGPTAGTLSSAQLPNSNILKYTDVQKVQDLLLLKNDITDTTNLSFRQVVDKIIEVEDVIDNETNRAWRTRYSGTKTGLDTTADYIYFDIDNDYQYQTGRSVYLPNRFIKTLSTAAGDILEIWDGSNWIDWTTNKTEGRASDFWLDYNQGILYIKSRYGVIGPTKGRIKYRYGESNVSGKVSRIAKRMVAIEIVTSESRAQIIPDGGTGMSYDQRVSTWRKEIEEELSDLKDFQVPYALM